MFMNKIIIENDLIKDMCVDSSINIEYKKGEGLFCINELIIIINENNDLNLYINVNDDTKLNIVINLLNDKECNLNINSVGLKGKIQYKYNINGKLSVDKNNSINNLKEMIIINLDSEKSSMDYSFINECSDKSITDYQVRHNYKNTILNMNNKNIVNGGEFSTQISCFISNEMDNCIENINNCVVNNGGKVSFKPNLYIDNKTSNVNIINTLSNN